MQIGRKIYYEKLTGNVILETSERQGFVRETTFEEDMQIYKALSERNPEAIEFIQLEYGQYSDKFGIYTYQINPVAKTIVWGDLIDPNIIPLRPTLEEQIAELKQDNLILMDALATTFEEILNLQLQIGGV